MTSYLSTSKRLFKSNFIFFAFSLFIIFLPNINNFIRTSFLILMPEQLSILAQTQWLGLVIEIAEAFLIVPIYYWLGRYKNDINELFSFVFYMLLAIFIIIILLLPILSAFVNYDINGSYLFLGYECFNSLLKILYDFFIAFLFVKNAKKQIVIFILIKFFIAALIDFSILKNNIFEMAVYSVNISGFLSNVICLVYFINTYKIRLKKPNFMLFISKNYILAIEQAMNNFSYMFVILAVLNIINSSGDYYTAMGYFWGYFLAPLMAFAVIIKKILAEQDLLKDKIFFVFLVDFILIIFAILSYFFMPQIAKFLLNANEQSIKIIKLLYPCYTAFILAFSMASIFYALGWFKRSICINLFVNLVVFLPAFLNMQNDLEFVINTFSKAIYLNLVSYLIVLFVSFKIGVKN